MSEQVAGSLDLYLKIGLAVSVQGKSEEEVAATVVSISLGELELELSTPPSQVPFQEGEKVGIKYWDTRAVLYYWDAKVVQISRPDNRHVTISISGDVVVQRRKSYRAQSAVPFSFTVIEAAERQLVDQGVRNSTTHNISVGEHPVAEKLQALVAVVPRAPMLRGARMGERPNQQLGPCEAMAQALGQRGRILCRPLVRAPRRAGAAIRCHRGCG